MLSSSRVLRKNVDLAAKKASQARRKRAKSTRFIFLDAKPSVRHSAWMATTVLVISSQAAKVLRVLRSRASMRSQSAVLAASFSASRGLAGHEEFLIAAVDLGRCLAEVGPYLLAQLLGHGAYEAPLVVEFLEGGGMRVITSSSAVRARASARRLLLGEIFLEVVVAQLLVDFQVVGISLAGLLIALPELCLVHGVDVADGVELLLQLAVEGKVRFTLSVSSARAMMRSMISFFRARFSARCASCSAIHAAFLALRRSTRSTSSSGSAGAAASGAALSTAASTSATPASAACSISADSASARAAAFSLLRSMQ